MIRSPLLRLTVAMYLALWTPLTCCCAIKSALGQVTGRAVAGCMSSGCGSPESLTPVIEPDITPSCCKSDQTTTNETSPVSDNECQCRDKPADFQRLDTSTTINVSQLSLNIDLAVIGFENSESELAERPIATMLLCRPPPPSLFLQHCLLLN